MRNGARSGAREHGRVGVEEIVLHVHDEDSCAGRIDGVDADCHVVSGMFDIVPSTFGWVTDRSA